ncbi:unnamed protein product [Gemmataceae bacterium]|nr:unnamed protein product [Gemmataceae bacterium]VTT99390.1 unnamed protein product [Gemmataceae bacterium]
MHLIAPDVLAEARGLTPAAAGSLCVLGVALWLFGWRWHRFWIVAGVTLGAGLCGLHAGRFVGGPQLLTVGVLLAVAAGMLALELARVFAFAAAGCAAWLGALWVFPQAQELWAVFLSAGLFGLILYRVWTMLLTSLAGAWLAGHAGLLVLEPLLPFDAVAWVASHQAAVNGGTIGCVVLGVVLQALLTRGDKASAGTEKIEKPKEKSELPKPPPEPKLDKPAPKPPAPPTNWWDKLVHPRKAG